MDEEKHDYLVKQGLKFGRRFVRCEGVVYEVRRVSQYYPGPSSYSAEEVVPYDIPNFAPDPHHYRNF